MLFRSIFMDNYKLVELFVAPLQECLDYKPHFGDNSKKDGFSVEEFLMMYGQDPFYSWIGLDSPYMYAAHKTAGSMTSVYRQIGIGCERLFRQIIFEQTGYINYSSSQWSYDTTTRAGKKKMVHPTFRVMRQSCRAYSLRVKYRSSLNPYALRFITFILLLIPSTFPVET